MKKALTLFTLAAVLGLAGCDFYGVTTTTAAPAEPETVVIATVDELVAMNNEDHYVLSADLDLGGLSWIPVGTPDDPFAGGFDGAGHTISNYSITAENGGFVGFFGSVTGDLENLTLADFAIDVAYDGLLYVGGLAAHTTGSIADCAVYGDIVAVNTSSSSYVGLLAGFAASYTTATMTTSEFVASTISGAYAEGSVDAVADHFLSAGGLVGRTANVVLSDCGARVSVVGTATVYRAYVGGLVGHGFGGLLKAHADTLEDVTFETVRCYADTALTVTAAGTMASAGGLYGYLQDGFVEDCFANATIVVGGSAVDVGGLAGELWYGSASTSVFRVGLTVAPSADLSLRFGGIAAFVQSEVVLTDCFRMTQSLFAATDPHGVEASADQLSSAQWYQDGLGWSAETFDIATVVGILS
ncbi:MAG: hypothetical protein WC509_08825 [Candidatus Izemoplasmatales bacterium]